MHAVDVTSRHRTERSDLPRVSSCEHVRHDPEFVDVMFRVPRELGAREAAVAGDFTAWVPVPMDADTTGEFRLRVRLLRGMRCSYRFLLDETTWINDLAATSFDRGPNGAPASIIET